MVSQIIHHDEINRPARLDWGEYRSAEIWHYFYTQNWQCVEERARRCCGTECHSVLRDKADDSDVPAPEDLDPDIQYVWGLRYIDDLILRDRDTTGNGTLDERLYAMQDANWNVVALADSNGDVVERYLYSAYGDPVVLNADFGEDSNGSDHRRPENGDHQGHPCHGTRRPLAERVSSAHWRFVCKVIVQNETVPVRVRPPRWRSSRKGLRHDERLSYEPPVGNLPQFPLHAVLVDAKHAKGVGPLTEAWVHDVGNAGFGVMLVPVGVPGQARPPRWGPARQAATPPVRGDTSGSL